MKIKINVKEEHIINGECFDVRRCAIALAVRDIFPRAAVFTNSLTLDSFDLSRFSFVQEKCYIINHPAEKQIIAFDGCGYKVLGRDRLQRVQPFSFEIEFDEKQVFPEKHLKEVKDIIRQSQNLELV